MKVSEGRALQVKTAVNAKALKWCHAWCILRNREAAIMVGQE